eukprot:3168174-Amphidinium_carterae.1
MVTPRTVSEPVPGAPKTRPRETVLGAPKTVASTHYSAEANPSSDAAEKYSSSSGQSRAPAPQNCWHT